MVDIKVYKGRYSDNKMYLYENKSYGEKLKKMRKPLKKIEKADIKKLLEQDDEDCIIGTVIYIGECLNKMPNGSGKLYAYCGGEQWIIKEGNFKNGKLNGEGMKQDAKGTVYKGKFEEGELEGRGVVEFSEGKFEGYFKKGKPRGFGTMCFYDGDIYKGYFKGWKPGDSVKYYKKGYGYTLISRIINAALLFLKKWSTLANFFVESNDLYQYEGSYNEDWIPDGYGKMYYSNGNIYEGRINIEKPEGKGVMQYANGDVYEGEFDNKGKINGFGKKCYADGSKVEGYFYKGVPIKTWILSEVNGREYLCNDAIQVAGRLKKKAKEFRIYGSLDQRHCKTR